MDFAAVGLNGLPFREWACAVLVLLTLAVDIRADQGKYGNGVSFIKNRNVVHRFEGGENFGPILLRNDRALWSLDFPNTAVAVDTHDQNVAESFGVTQTAHVPGVNQVETPVGPDYCLTGLCPGATQHREFFRRPEF